MESEAISWHQLGRIAEKQQDWSEAERNYRECLAIRERLGDAAGAARTCNQLGLVAEKADRPVEAEGWYTRGLELFEKADPDGSDKVKTLSNLASLLCQEVQAGRAPITRLSEAQGYAKQALAIKDTLDASAEIWMTLSVLAKIADMEGQAEEAREYRRRERETFAAFEGNRHHIDHQCGGLIAAIAAAARGDMQAQEAAEAELPQAEANDWQITAATRRIWSGERDWYTLAEDLDRGSALLILRVLETIDVAEGRSALSTPEELIAALPASILDAIQQGDEATFARALRELSPEEQLAVLQALQNLMTMGNPEQNT